MFPPDKRPQRLERLSGRDVGDEYLFYDGDSDSVHVLNGTAREIYLLCDGTRSVDKLVAAMLERYEIDETTAREDVDSTLRRLIDLGMLSVS